MVFTDRRHGHFSSEPGAVPTATVPHPLTWMHQVHGATVLDVREPGDHAGTEADAAVTTVSGAALAVITADCAPIAVIAEGGGVAVVHAGWRGLLADVVTRAVETLSRRADGPYLAVLGPCIHPESYEFSEPDLAVVAARFGDGVRSTTSTGQPALDVPATVRAAFDELDVGLDTSMCECTASSRDFFSHRARGEAERQAVVVWIDDP